MQRCLALCCAVAALAASGAPAAAQCTAQWNNGVAGPGGPVSELLVWDPDGAGPLTPVLVVGGSFTTVGGVNASNIATCNPEVLDEWVPLGAGLNGPVLALGALAGGELVVGGLFTTAGSASASNIARWDGSAWSALGSGTNGAVYALTLIPPPWANNDLIAGGAFTMAGGTTANRVARWNGSQWTSVPGGMNNEVRALVRSPIPFDGGVPIAAGFFTLAGSSAANRIARWSGLGWQPVGTLPLESPGVNGEIYALAAGSGPELIVGGAFQSAGGVSAPAIARWDGSNWSAFGSGMNNTVTAVAHMPNADVVAAGVFTTAGGVSANRIARWNGSVWTPLGAGMDSTVSALAVTPAGSLVAGGHFTTAGGQAAPYLARWGCPPPAPCYPNCDGSTQPPILNVQDFTCFLQQYAAGNTYANCDNSAIPPTLNVQDFTCFLQRYAAGCP
jgi:trimeric autotransporter adhesin